jgi:hypothetical protein
LHKKGDQLECKNYRGITLLASAYKIFGNVLSERLKHFTKDIVGQYQCGFTAGKSTTHQIQAHRQILEKSLEYNIETHHLFIDFKAAYDSVKRTALYNAMIDFGIPPKLVKLTHLTMQNLSSCVRIEGENSTFFDINNGLRQGDALACLLFNIALEKAIRQLNIRMNGTIFNRSTQILAFADDIVIVGRSMRDMVQCFTRLADAASELGLVVNEEKTKYMLVSKNPRNIQEIIQINNHTFEQVKEFTYLGSLVNATNTTSDEIKRRIAIANRTVHGLQRHLKNKNIKRALKLNIYRTLIRPVLIYGAETWILSQNDKRLLGIFERKILRKIFGAVNENGLWRRRYNFELYQLYTDPDIVKFVKVQRLRWAGHIARMSDHEYTKRLTFSQPEGTRSRGRPRMRWIDDVEEDLQILGVRRWREVARNRQEWRLLCEQAKIHNGLSSHL